MKSSFHPLTSSGKETRASKVKRWKNNDLHYCILLANEQDFIIQLHMSTLKKKDFKEALH